MCCCCCTEGEVVDRELLDREMWSLDKDEAAAVKKRVDTLNATLNKREQQRADVREIFASSTQVEVGWYL